jgi:hypothetical protein
MVFEYMVYGVYNETEPTSFEDAISGPQPKEWIEGIQSQVCSLDGNKTREPYC